MSSIILSIAHSSIFKVMVMVLVMKFIFALYCKLYYMIKILILYIIFKPKLNILKKVLDFYTLQNIYSRYLLLIY